MMAIYVLHPRDTLHDTTKPVMDSNALAKMEGMLEDIQQWHRDTAWLAKQKNKQKEVEAKQAAVYAASFPELVTKAPHTVFDAENLWMRILHDSKIPAENIKVINLDDGERPQTYRGLNIYRLFEVAADESRKDDSIELHRARNKLCVSIHIIRQKEAMTLELLDSWLQQMKEHIDAEYGWRPQAKMMCILSCGTRVWFRQFLRPNADETGSWLVDSTVDWRGETEEEGGKVVTGDNIDLSTPFGLWYAESFLEKSFHEAGCIEEGNS